MDMWQLSLILFGVVLYFLVGSWLLKRWLAADRYNRGAPFLSVIRERQNRELSAAFHRACAYLAEECVWCPLVYEDGCAKKVLPEAALSEDRVSICADWLSLHFRKGS